MLRPGTIHYNSSVRLTVTWNDEDGVAFDPSAVVFETYGPDDTKTTYAYGVGDEVTRSSEGSYFIDIPANKTGKWQYRWGATDGSTSLYREGKFYVQRSDWYDGQERAYQL
jgi:hypothetical protein